MWRNKKVLLGLKDLSGNLSCAPHWLCHLGPSHGRDLRHAAFGLLCKLSAPPKTCGFGILTCRTVQPMKLPSQHLPACAAVAVLPLVPAVLTALIPATLRHFGRNSACAYFTDQSFRLKSNDLCHLSCFLDIPEWYNKTMHWEQMFNYWTGPCLWTNRFF